MKDGIDLASWMQANKAQWQSLFSDINEEYVPCALAGLYLKNQYQVYKEKAQAQGIKIIECYDEVIDMAFAKNESYRLKTINSEFYHSHQKRPTASYGHKYPTPYASFIVIEAIEKVLSEPIFELLFLSNSYSMTFGR